MFILHQISETSYVYDMLILMEWKLAGLKTSLRTAVRRLTEKIDER